MIVLMDAHFADIAVVPSAGDEVSALEAHLLQSLFALLPDQLIVVFGLSLRCGCQQRQVQKYHGGEDNDLRVERIPLAERDERIEDGSVEYEGDQEDEGIGELPVGRSILDFDIAVQLEHVHAGEFLIEHPADGFELVLAGDLQWGFVLVVADIPICPFDQQSAHHARVAVEHGQHEGGVAFVVAVVQTVEVGVGQQERGDFFAVGIGCPVERGAVELVPTVDIHASPEIDEWDEHILLGCEVEGVETRFCGELVVDLMLLDEILNDIEMSAVGGVEESSEAFVVLAVHPVLDLLVVVFLVELLFGAAEFADEALADFLDEEPDDVEVAFVGELMEDGVVLVVRQR